MTISRFNIGVFPALLAIYGSFLLFSPSPNGESTNQTCFDVSPNGESTNHVCFDVSPNGEGANHIRFDISPNGEVKI